MVYRLEDRLAWRSGGGVQGCPVRPGGGPEAWPGCRIVKFGVERFDLRFERGNFRIQRPGAFRQWIGFLFEEGHTNDHLRPSKMKINTVSAPKATIANGQVKPSPSLQS